MIVGGSTPQLSPTTLPPAPVPRAPPPLRGTSQPPEHVVGRETSKLLAFPPRFFPSLQKKKHTHTQYGGRHASASSALATRPASNAHVSI